MQTRNATDRRPSAPPSIKLLPAARSCAFTNKASTHNQQIRCPCQATKDDEDKKAAKRQGKVFPERAHFFVRCETCDGYQCVACLGEFSEAIKLHNTGKYFRLPIKAIETLLAANWSAIGSGKCTLADLGGPDSALEVDEANRALKWRKADGGPCCWRR